MGVLAGKAVGSMFDWKAKETNGLKEIARPSQATDAVTAGTVTVGAVAALAPGERLLIEGMRLAFAGRSPQSLFCLACGEVAGETACHGLEGFLNLLRGSARRALWLPTPATPGIVTQERAVLDLVAAIQAGHEVLVAALLAWLFPATHVEAVRVHVRLLASALGVAGVRLPLSAPARLQPPIAGKVPPAFACVV